MPITINYREPITFAPNFTITERFETLSAGTKTAFTHRSLSSFNYVYPSGTQIYDFAASNIEDAVKTSEPAGSVDFSQFPTIRAAAGFTGSAKVILTGSRATRKSDALIFSPLTNVGVKGYDDGDITLVNGTYAKYSINKVIALADSLPNNKFLAVVNGVIVRQNLAQFPHQHVTGTAVAQNVDGVNRLAGYRPSAITKRHVVHCGHYGGLPIGRKLYFLPADNGPLVERTIVGGTNFAQLTDLDTLPIPVGLSAGKWDFEMCILNADLPDSIKPYPIAYSAIDPILSSNSSEVTVCSQFGSIILFHNDGHFAVSFANNLSDLTRRQSVNYLFDNPRFGLVFDGLPLTSSTCQLTSTGNYSSYLFDSFNRGDLNYLYPAEAKFHHWPYAGDSGSPMLLPVGANEFALNGFVSTYANPDAATYNALIQRVDARAVAANQITAPTGYTVRVATAPTL
jgi:hypothetical protein